jgi:hypothetical protein
MSKHLAKLTVTIPIELNSSDYDDWLTPRQMAEYEVTCLKEGMVNLENMTAISLEKDPTKWKYEITFENYSKYASGTV